MNDDRLSDLAQDASVNPRIIFRAFCRRCKRPAGHNYKPAAHRFDGLDLLFVRANDVVDTNVWTRIEMVGAYPATDLYARTTLCGLKGMTYQLSCSCPIEPSAPLCRIHCFGNTEAEIPKIVPKMDGLLPVDCGIEPGIGIGQWIRHDVRGRKRDAVEIFGSLFGRKNNRLARRIRLKFAISCRQDKRGHALLLYLEVGHVDPAPLFPALQAKLCELNTFDALDKSVVPGCICGHMTDEIFPLQFEAVLVDDIFRHFLPL